MDIQEFNQIFESSLIEGEKIIIQNNIAQAVEFVKNTYHFDMLKEIIAVNNEDGSTELIYNMYSTENEENVLLSITVDREVESVSKIFGSAIADENEIYDLFGINFIGNDNLKRLYMPETWEGHPLRKDYTENDEKLRWNDRT